MRQFLHNLIDNIFDFFLDIYRILITMDNYILCFFKHPKYKLHTHIYYPYGKFRWYMIMDFKKDFKTNIILYKLSEFNYLISEGVIEFYQIQAPNEIERIYGDKK